MVIKLRKKGVRVFENEAQKKKVEELEKKSGFKPTITIRKKEKKEKEKTGISKFREKDTIAGKTVKAATSLKTTAVLAAGLGGVATGAAAGIAATGGAAIARTAIQKAAISPATQAVITRTATAIKLGRPTITTQRAFVGKPATSGVDKIFHTVRPVASRFASNKKSQGLTSSFLLKAGLSISAIGLTMGAIGSYPFAGFIKEEALQTLSIPIMKAIDAGDLETAKRQIEAVDELLNKESTILDKIPYENVWRQLKNFFESARISNEAWKEIISSEEANIAEQEETPSFAEERETADTENRQRQLEERARDAEYFALIREGKFEEANELLQSELKGG